jgi:hypothetical protein
MVSVILSLFAKVGGPESTLVEELGTDKIFYLPLQKGESTNECTRR